jgi:hypothetical protein
MPIAALAIICAQPGPTTTDLFLHGKSPESVALLAALDTRAAREPDDIGGELTAPQIQRIGQNRQRSRHVCADTGRPTGCQGTHHRLAWFSCHGGRKSLGRVSIWLSLLEAFPAGRRTNVTRRRGLPDRPARSCPPRRRRHRGARAQRSSQAAPWRRTRHR